MMEYHWEHIEAPVSCIIRFCREPVCYKEEPQKNKNFEVRVSAYNRDKKDNSNDNKT